MSFWSYHASHLNVMQRCAGHIKWGPLTNYFVFVLGGQQKTVSNQKEKKKIKCAQCDISLVSWGEFLMRSCFSTILRGTRQYCVHLGSCILMTAAACYCQDIKCPFFHWQGPQILPIGHAPILLFRHVAWKNHFNVNQPAHTFLRPPISA